MATPNRLKNNPSKTDASAADRTNPTSVSKPNRLSAALSPLARVAKVITPTGIGVLLSVGAHAALITAGPRIDLSFDALTKEALEANPEETVVPILQLSEAERNRLPSFAQPRRPPASTGLSSLQLPSGLPSLPSSRSIRRRPVPSQPIPSPSTSRPKPIGQALPNRSIQTTPFQLDFPIRTPGLPIPSASSGTPYIPSTPTPSVPSASSGSNSTVTFDENGLPILTPGTPNSGDAIASNQDSSGQNGSGQSRASAGDAPSDGTSLSEALANTQGVGIAVNPAPGEEDTSSESNAGAASGETIRIETTSEQIASAPAEGDASQLLKGSTVYSSAGVSDTEAEENLTAWLQSSAQGKEQVASAEEEITIDSGFKACREIAPVNGLIGVLVNPDGSRSNIEMLKSTGYGSLNSLALSTLEYEEFGQPDVPTQYQIDVQVVYEPQDCVEDLPDAPAE